LLLKWDKNPNIIYGIIGAAAALLAIILFCIIKHVRKPRNREDVFEQPDTLKSGTWRSDSNDYRSPDSGYIPPKVTAYSYTPAQPMNGSHSSVESDGYIQPRTNSQDDCYLQEQFLIFDQKPGKIYLSN
jgi:hypothetical protein